MLTIQKSGIIGGMGRKRNPDIAHRGINSVMIGMRFSLSDYGLIVEESKKEGLSVGGWCKGVLISRIHTVNNRKGERGIPLYNPNIHRAGDRVIVWKKGRMVEMIVPELDLDGNRMP